ncbi:MAG: NAD+ synthase [Bdellovibrionales bacterium]|jgi:NAD+ synthase (glutamine-hydrolysing)|nr:NAD+ synthase [Bdellovibrionales bacterium]
MRVALAQMNAVLGDFSGNREKIISFARRALDRRCDLVVFPEHALFGYLPTDLLERGSIVEAQLRELKRLEKELPKGILVLVGCVTFADDKRTSKQATGRTLGKGVAESLSVKRYYNSAALMERGKKTRFFHKERLASFDVFDEARHYRSGELSKNRFKLKGKTVQVTICEDIWGWGQRENELKKVKRSGVDLVVNLSASPFTKTKRARRHDVLKKTVAHFKAPAVYVNMVGGQDEIVFDGRSVIMDKKGKVRGELVAFQEDLGVYDLETEETGYRESFAEIEILRLALVQGIRDFALKTGLGRCHFGLSGGIDSAVVACLAVDALGPQAVTAITLPGPFNDPSSRVWAEKLASQLGIQCLNIEIEPAYEALKNSFEGATGLNEFGLVHENLQARTRGVLLMAYSNLSSSLLLSTGNKAEYAAGYSTLYGDQCGGLAPLGDLLKSEVYELARYYNSQAEVIPSEIIDRPPSAELRPGQKDQDSLPPYDELDAAVVRIIERREPARTKTETWLLNASLKSEFKRWQAAPILKVSDHAFGRGRRLPIAHRAKD